MAKSKTKEVALKSVGDIKAEEPTTKVVGVRLSQDFFIEITVDPVTITNSKVTVVTPDATTNYNIVAE